MATPQTTFTLTIGDFAAFATIATVIAGLLWFVIRQSMAKVVSDVAVELVKSENRIVEKVRMQFVEKDMMDVKLKSLDEKVEQLKKENGN